MMAETAQPDIAKEMDVTRAEWLGAAALALSFMEGAYIAGVETQRLNDHDRRLTTVEVSQTANVGKIEQLLVAVSRIDANVSALADRAKDDRQGRGK